MSELSLEEIKGILETMGCRELNYCMEHIKQLVLQEKRKERLRWIKLEETPPASAKVG